MKKRPAMCVSRLLAVAMCAMVFAGCDNDDDDSSDTSIPTTVVGKWSGSIAGWTTITFNANGTFVCDNSYFTPNSGKYTYISSSGAISFKMNYYNWNGTVVGTKMYLTLKYYWTTGGEFDGNTCTFTKQ